MKKVKYNIIAPCLAGTVSAVLFLFACAPNTVQVTTTPSPSSSISNTNEDTFPDFSNRTLKQMDRLAIPSLNIVLNGYNGFTKPVYDSLKMSKEARDGAKDKSNMESPETDIANYRDFWSTALQAVFKRTKTDADGIATALTPDVYTMDVNKQTEFKALNGRMLSDDVVDVELKLLSGNNAATDGVNINDKQFSGQFPFLANPF